jgi:glycosyltransferase involved in cell wall biosynthesis
MVSLGGKISMLVSIITSVLNARPTIEDTITSVLGQTYKNVEYIIVDGGSTDGTTEIIKSYGKKITKFISEPDKGIYDAMNKGIKLASGEIIGILNSDDFYANDFVIETVVKTMSEKKVDAYYGDLVYVDRYNTNKVIRYWRSCEYQEGLFSKGWMPPHPTFFVKRWVYEEYGAFDLSLPVAADHEMMVRFMYKYKIKACYIPEVLVKMRMGGVTNNNIFNIIKQNLAIVETLRKNQINISLPFFIIKFIERLRQYFYHKI